MEVFLVLFIVAAFVFAGLRWYYSDAQKARRRLRAAVSAPIAEVRDGELVKITGALLYASDETLEAPLSKRRCSGYLVQVHERRGSGKNSRWVELLRDEETRPFLVEDETGTAYVEPRGARLLLVRDERQTSGTFNDASPEVEAYLQAHGISSEGLFGLNKGMRYNEAVLEEGETVAILGKARWEVDPDPARTAGYRERAKRLVVDMADDGTFMITDEPELV